MSHLYLKVHKHEVFISFVHFQKTKNRTEATDKNSSQGSTPFEPEATEDTLPAEQEGA